MGYRILLCDDIGEREIEMLLSGSGNSDVDVSADIIQVPYHSCFIMNTGNLVKSVKTEHATLKS